VTWVRHRFFAKRFPQATMNALGVARVRRESLDARLKFHWSSVRAQMRGLDPAVLERSPSNGLTPLIELLGIPRRLRAATGGAECRKVFGTSTSLGPTARREAANDQMEFLSAFNDRAWSSLYIGWEIREMQIIISNANVGWTRRIKFGPCDVTPIFHPAMGRILC